jgi:hypothetical protein
MVPMDVKSAFAEILDKLPRQHLRVRFRNRFGTELSDFGTSTFARGTVRAGLDRRLGHLMQEEPQKLVAARLSGPSEDLKFVSLTPLASDTLASVLEEGEGERLVVVHGSTARLYVYLAPGDEEAWVRRISVEKTERPNAKPPAPTLSRRERAARAGKTKMVKKPQRRRQR